MSSDGNWSYGNTCGIFMSMSTKFLWLVTVPRIGSPGIIAPAVMTTGPREVASPDSVGEMPDTETGCAKGATTA